MTRPHYIRGKSFRYALKMRMWGFRAGLDAVEKSETL
jgi:hypothetical protein